MDEKQIRNLMVNLGICREEAIQVIEDDKRIDRGEKLFELSPEEKRVEKKMRQAERKSPNFQFSQRQKKPDEDKRNIINLLVSCVLDKNANSYEVINPEREIVFFWGNKKYKIVLSCPRD